MQRGLRLVNCADDFATPVAGRTAGKRILTLHPVATAKIVTDLKPTG